MDYKHWVVGFVFRNEKSEVALVLKNRPEFQKGKLNGPGGKIEEGETPAQAMRREFKEETGADIQDWRAFALLKEEAGDVTFLVSHSSCEVQTMTDEPVAWHRVEDLKKLPVLSDLRWLIPLALDDQNRFSTVDYDQPR